jgi:hypothetical protein
MRRLGLPKTLLGVDAVAEAAGADLGERELLTIRDEAVTCSSA